MARLIKVAMITVLVPLAIGLLRGTLDQLGLMSWSNATFREWISWGFFTYVGIHVLLYRPMGLFRASHRAFSTLAVWLFGRQVASVEPVTTEKGKRSTDAADDPAAQGSTLVAFSPYIVPVYTLLICACGWGIRQWWDRTFTDGLVSFLIGLSIAFHWLMTAESLQQQRSRWHIETYLLALGLVFVLTLLIVSAALPLAVPEFSFLRALNDGLAYTQELYRASVQRFFL